ncbi:hypothetical protein PCE1_002928 [Barthelona sp. PCE]
MSLQFDRPTEWAMTLASKLGIPDPDEIWKLANEIQQYHVKDKDELQLERFEHLAALSSDDSEFDSLDDEEDEAFMQALKAQRFRKAKEFAENSRYGSLRQISKADYVREVSNVDGWVVLLLHQDHLEISNLVRSCLCGLAKRYPTHKFVQIKADDCVEGYADQLVPTVLVYFDKVKMHNFVGPSAFGGERCTTDYLEYLFGQFEILETDFEEDPLPKISAGSRFNLTIHGRKHE